MTWTFENKTFDAIPEDFSAIGFVYMITNLTNGRRYIGKKNLYAAQTRVRVVKLKTTGEKKKKKIRSTVESNWKDYYGSSDELCKDVESFGKENFKREILRFCASKGELSYFEAKYQFNHDVLLHGDLWYNSWVSVKVHKAHLKKVVTDTTT